VLLFLPGFPCLSLARGPSLPFPHISTGNHGDRQNARGYRPYPRSSAPKSLGKNESTKNIDTAFVTAQFTRYGLTIKDPFHETSAIFLAAGFQAWLAYFVAHCDVQASTRRTLGAFDGLPPQERTHTANRIASVECHDTVREAIRGFLDRPYMRCKETVLHLFCS